MATPKQTDPQFKLRLTAELKREIEAAASENNRSMNAEIIARLENHSVSDTNRQKLVELGQQVAELAAARERDDKELIMLRRVCKRFIQEDGTEKPVLAISPYLMGRISLSARISKRTVDEEASLALENAYPSGTVDIHLLTHLLKSLEGVSVSDDSEDYFEYINFALAAAKAPWTVESGPAGELCFRPHANTPSAPESGTDDK